MADVSIKKIAEVAGVSRGTVDRALNNREGINPTQKEQILKVAAELGYRSNRAGRMLSIRKSPIRIGVHMPSEGNPFFEEVLAGLTAAQEHYHDFGLSLVLKTMKGFDAAVQERQIRELVAEGITALALVPISSPCIASLIDELTASGIPVVTFNSDIAGTKRLCYVGNDYARSGAVAAGAMRLLTQGSNATVMVLTGSEQILGHRQRVAGFVRTLEQSSPNVRILGIAETQDDDDIAEARIGQALAEHPDMAAVYIAAGGVAGACRAIERSGRAGRIHVISNDLTSIERDYLRRGVISLTIGQQPYDQGYVPIRILFDHFLDGSMPEECHYTGCELILREHLQEPPQEKETGDEASSTGAITGERNRR